jgi:endo-1,4-beta-xylanase
MAVLFYTSLFASAPESEIAITGSVTDGRNPVENAIVTLVSDSLLSDTTDANGEFVLSDKTGIITEANRNSAKNGMMRLHGSRLQFFVPGEVEAGEIKLFTAGGSCILRHVIGKKISESVTVDLPKIASGLYLVKISADRIAITRKLVVTGTEMYPGGIGTHAVSSAGIHKAGLKQAAVDQLKITKEGFAAKLVDLSSYETEDLSILFEPDSIANATSLCKRYTNLFPIGAAIDANSYRDSHAAIWKEHFNSMVCENEMKWDALEPQAGNFQFGTANGMVNAAIQNGMLVRGHCLVWFNQTPDWVFQGSKEQVLQRLRNHVTRVVQEFKGRVYAWDVVNEAVIGYDASGQDVGEELGNLDHWGYRDSKWYQITGEDHIFEAFRTAREVDPDVKLFYNDYWNYLDEKREFIISFVKRLQEENLIDGVGLQCHLNISAAQEQMTNQSAYQTVGNLEKEIQEYAALGLDVHITELDISIYTRDYSSDDHSKWYNGNDLNEEYQDRLAARYKEFFDMFRRNADKIQNVTLWGISDDNTWLSEFDSGRPDHPLLFDKHLQPKKAFDAIMDF